MNPEEIHSLSREEKVLIVETLRDHFREDYEQAKISEEHKEILNRRRQRYHSGVARLLNWDDVKFSIGS